jgi:hypothetical protein
VTNIRDQNGKDRISPIGKDMINSRQKSASSAVCLPLRRAIRTKPVIPARVTRCRVTRPRVIRTKSVIPVRVTHTIPAIPAPADPDVELTDPIPIHK